MSKSWTQLSGLVGYFSFSIKSKSDLSTYDVPSKVYTTNKYDIDVTFCNDTLLSSSCVMCLIQIVYSLEHEKQVMKDGDQIAKGLEKPLTLLPSPKFPWFETSHKFQFSSSSFHHGKMSFAFKLLFYSVNSMTEPVAVFLSNSFKVAARREAIEKPVTSTDPSEMTEKKRKNKEATSSCKKTKFEEFHDVLDHLEKLSKELPDHERDCALQDIRNRFNVQQPIEYQDHSLDFFNLESNYENL